MRKLFGTDGIRGKANIYPMDAPTAYRVGAAIGHYFRAKQKRPKVLIGRDTRISGNMIESSLVAGLCSVGAKAVLLGVISTPGVAYLTRSAKADAGVVISASHNPFIDNGIKIFSENGFKLPDTVEEKIEEIILEREPAELHVQPHEVGSSTMWEDGIEEYISALKETTGKRSFSGMRIILDCAHGAAYHVAPVVFRRLGVEISTLGIEPNGLNINKGVGSLHTERLQQRVIEEKAFLGVAFDGDADRAIFIDARGDIVDGDQIMAICARKLKSEGKLAHNTLVATVMSNIGLSIAMEEAGINLVRTAVGDRYVVEKMLEKGYNFGGEQSGHLIFLDHGTTGDGVLAALQVLSILVDTGKALHELASIMTSYPQTLKNLMVDYKYPLEELSGAQTVIKQVEKELGSKGRVLVRYSGTENKVRVMVEGMDKRKIEVYADKIIRALDEELN